MIAAGKDEIRGWFKKGAAAGRKYMLVVYDRMEYPENSDSPVYADSAEQAREEFEVNSNGICKVMEVYDLSADMEEQLSERRAWRLPPKEDCSRERFRAARAGDGAELLKLNDIFNGAEPVENLTAEVIDNKILNNSQELVCVAEGDGELAGFCCAQIFSSICYSVDYAEITDIFVLEKYRRNGVGRELMETAERELNKRGINYFQLFTGKTNTAAQSFYRVCGYEPSTELMFRKRPKDENAAETSPLIGKTASVTAVVTADETAEKVGSGSLPVFATPMLTALMEAAACKVLESVLEDGQTSVGTFISTTHTAASPIGAEITAAATIERVNGRGIEFAVTAKDGEREIGSGKHARVIVDAERFMSKNKKEAGYGH